MLVWLCISFLSCCLRFHFHFILCIPPRFRWKYLAIFLVIFFFVLITMYFICFASGNYVWSENKFRRYWLSRKGRFCSYICFHYELSNSGRGTALRILYGTFIWIWKTFTNNQIRDLFIKCTGTVTAPLHYNVTLWYNVNIKLELIDIYNC